VIALEHGMISGGVLGALLLGIAASSRWQCHLMFMT
jgi:hypothetical protein